MKMHAVATISDIDLSATLRMRVGNLTTADEDSPETHSYTVSDNRFEVVDDGNGNQQLKLKDGIALDSEAENGAVCRHRDHHRRFRRELQRSVQYQCGRCKRRSDRYRSVCQPRG